MMDGKEAEEIPWRISGMGGCTGNLHGLIGVGIFLPRNARPGRST